MTMEEMMAAANAKFLAESAQEPPDTKPSPTHVMAEISAQVGAAQAEPAS